MCARKINNKQITDRFQTLHNGEYALISEYKNSNSPAILKHKTCGHEFKVARLTKFFNDETYTPCPFCKEHPAKVIRMTKETLQTKVDSLYGTKKYEILEYTKMHAQVKVKCLNCKNEFFIRGSDLVNKEKFSGCPKCRVNLRGMHQHDENYLENALLERTDGKEYEWLDPYSGNPKDKHHIKHLTCGNIYEVKPVNFRYGDKTSCPFCARKKSKNEASMFSELSKYISDLKESDRHEINPYELDMFSPSKKIAIEYNGLFWHDENHKGRKYHEAKRLKCKEKGIRLIQVYEDEWLNRKDIVLSKILSIFGISSPEKKIYARKCICKKMEKDDYRLIYDFYNENHIQGACAPAAISYGLYYENELVALGSFNKLRKSMNSENAENGYDMIRYAAKLNYEVIGGCGKIISTFVKENNCQYLKTIADLRWSSESENMYLKLGFSKANYIPPRYFYTDGHKRFPRFAFRKDAIKTKFPDIYDPKLTEFQLMDKTQLRRIWDAGKITYEKKF